eukprot:Mycagemm_TRINITY_DN9358_c0_g1::TRINITY_DN9358_c0_g1_i1::g.3238::m.3238 type:complete len:105 gc:universal TRINITY_DN9358_c0_g1_i1:914-600(-)
MCNSAPRPHRARPGHERPRQWPPAGDTCRPGRPSVPHSALAVKDLRGSLRMTSLAAGVASRDGQPPSCRAQRLARDSSWCCDTASAAPRVCGPCHAARTRLRLA